MRIAGSYTVENNLWYNAGFPNVIQRRLGRNVYSGSQLLPERCGMPLRGFGECMQNTSALDPFANWQSSNFNLASDNADWNNRVSLSAPYNADAAGKLPFTTDRGAYQARGSDQGLRLLLQVWQPSVQ